MSDSEHSSSANSDEPISKKPRNYEESKKTQKKELSDRHLNSRLSDKDIQESKKNSKQELNANTKTDDGDKKQKLDTIYTKTGGAYIPPAKLRMMQEQITDKTSEGYQRISWEALKKSINGLINKVNKSNLPQIVRELFQENIVRGKGLLARSIIQAQNASPTFTNVYAALVAVINTKFPQIGELILKRLLIQFRKGFRRNNKTQCLSALNFIAHLVNQQVAHEILALEVLTLLLESPTNDSVEVAIGFLRESGAKLTEVTPRGAHAIFERLRFILHEGQVEQRVQYMIEVMFATRKDGFKDHPSIVSELDQVEEDDQYTHMLTLENAIDGEDNLNVFKFDSMFLENEEKYRALSREILDESSSESGEDDEDKSESESENEEVDNQNILDKTETNLVELRKTIYLTVQSSLDFEECAHKLLKMELKPNQEKEVASMILDCCAQQRTYEKFFGLLGQRFCMLKQEYMGHFQEIFKEQYDTIHRLETTKLRNVARFFSHLLFSDGISWEVLQTIKLNEDDTTSSSRIFIKLFFQDLSEHLGLAKLLERLHDETLQHAFEGIFPRDNPRNTRFAINFFTSIGLGGLTDELREHLKTMPKMQPRVLSPINSDSSGSSDSSDSGSESSSSSSSSSSSTSSSQSSEDEKRRRKKVLKDYERNSKLNMKNKESSRKNETPLRKEGRENINKYHSERFNSETRNSDSNEKYRNDKYIKSNKYENDFKEDKNKRSHRHHREDSDERNSKSKNTQYEKHRSSRYERDRQRDHDSEQRHRLKDDYKDKRHKARNEKR